MNSKAEREVQDHEEAELLRRAQKRMERCVNWESYSRRLFQDDVKFANADPDNGFQWPTKMRDDREREARPALTVNKTRQHNLNIINDAKLNKPGIKFRAMGNGATTEAARVWDGIARHIEYQSNAQAHYDRATTSQVQGGIGWLRVTTDYVGDNTFDQDIFVTSVPDPLSVYIDPDARAPAKEDARFAFVFEDLAKDDFEAKYPDYKAYSGQNVLVQDRGWRDDDHVRVAEYFEAVDLEDELLLVESKDGQQMSVFASAVQQIMGKKSLKDFKVLRSRKMFRREIHYYFIVGTHVVKEETKIWPGKTIPLVPVIGEETIIDGRMDRKGHTRALKDPQRMYNYWSSAAVEYGALQSKTPWIVAVESVEGFEAYWNTANRVNHAYLPYKAMNGDKQLPPPQRQEPPVPSPVALKGMEMANIEMQMVSGQYENQMGQQGNERTGRAIAERQRQGDKATYHFIDNLAIAIRQVGKIVMDLVPKIYDTERTIMILADDGVSLEVRIDPAQQQAFAQKLDENQQVVARVLNPAVGTYEVQADVGPAYATRKEEAFNALTLILTQAPQLAAIIGDILFRAGDFPMADEAAERLRRMVPPQALGQGPTPGEQQLGAQVQQLQKALVAAMDELANEKIKGKARLEKRDVDVYNAITNRIKALGDQAMSAMQLQHLAAEAIRESADVPISDVFEHNAGLREAGQEPQFTLPFDAMSQPPRMMLNPNDPSRLLRVMKVPGA